LALVRGIEKSKRQQILVRQVVSLCKELGARVVAEGIETVEDAEALLALGVDYGQGWHYGRPGPPEALSPYLPAASASSPPGATRADPVEAVPR